jgi:L-threonylcarbamoyladenylate synthase
MTTPAAGFAPTDVTCSTSKTPVPPVVTEVLTVDPREPDPTVIARAAACLRAGGLVAFPTETVYGLGAHALDVIALRRIFDAKGRPSQDPLIVHVGDFGQILALVSRLPLGAIELGARFWPGPLTLVMPRSTAVPNEVTAGLETVAVRIPSHAVARALLAAARVPIAAPSANLFSRPSPTRAEHVLEDLNGRIDMILDAGATEVGVESTVLDLSTGTPTVLRPGAISIESLRELVPSVRMRDTRQEATNTRAMASPGLLTKHYSPRTPLTLYEGDPARALARLQADADAARAAGQRVGVLDLGGHPDLERVAARLYAELRDLDSQGLDVILARGCATEEGIGLAIVDRLRRAAAGRIERV